VARAAWRDEELRATYRQHRSMAERSIAWLVAKGNRRLRYRGVERNETWLNRRVAALNLRRLVVLGLTRSEATHAGFVWLSLRDGEPRTL